jgi:hypothetical protein
MSVKGGRLTRILQERKENTKRPTVSKQWAFPSTRWSCNIRLLSLLDTLRKISLHAQPETITYALQVNTT